LVLGLLLAILSAIDTQVVKACGYRGLGDVFVFVFFGLVKFTLGIEFLYSKQVRI
jgi:1,4-dihydroxy-2-naphthoate octaprenyltransferase